MKLDFFIDSHCHLFTIADIPLFRPLELADGTLDNPFLYGLLPFAMFARLAIRPERIVREYQPYIRFFENEPGQNVALLTGQVTEALKYTQPPNAITGSNVVLTPLIMDFDAGGQVTKLKGQLERLKTAVSAVTSSVKVLPFLGLHPGRTDAKELLQEVSSVKDRGGYEQTDTGSFIGVKLYPPLGFDPADSAFTQFYTRLARMEVPVTVHCQKRSFELVKHGGNLAHPKNWIKAFALMGADATRLRINFAHFGGEEEVARTVSFDKKDGNQLSTEEVYAGICRDTWTYTIISMLKKYPNAYADLSAFDFYNKKAVAALHWLLYLDKQARLGENLGPYKLEDKILWGSDYPMILGDKIQIYWTLLNKFITTFHFQGMPLSPIEYPPRDALMNQEEFLRKVFCDNPRTFLFG
jgi:hypothetical protein